MVPRNGAKSCPRAIAIKRVTIWIGIGNAQNEGEVDLALQNGHGVASGFEKSADVAVSFGACNLARWQ